MPSEVANSSTRVATSARHRSQRPAQEPATGTGDSPASPVQSFWNLKQLERCSPEKIAVRAKPHESKLVGGHLHVDQQEVGPDVELAAIAPVPGQVMIAVAHRQRPVVRQRLQNRVEEIINVFVAGI